MVSYPHDDKYELLKYKIIEGLKEKCKNVDTREGLINFVKETLNPKNLIDIYKMCFPFDVNNPSSFVGPR